MGERAAARGDWKIKRMGRKRRAVAYARAFTRDEWLRARRGVLPASMDDRWFIFVEGDRVWFHRSWTGDCAFEVRVEIEGDAARAAEAWCDAAVFTGTDDEASKMLGEVVELVLLAPPPESEADWVVSKRV